MPRSRRSRSVLSLRLRVAQVYLAIAPRRGQSETHGLSKRILLPPSDKVEAVSDNAIQRLISVDNAVGPLRKRIAQLRFHPVS
jgi:hypothetical protein